MGAVVVSFDGTRVDAGDALGSQWTDAGGKSANLEPDFVYQRSSGTDGAVSEKVGTSRGGIRYTEVSARDVATNDTVYILKCIATNNSALNNEGVNGGYITFSYGVAGNGTYYVVGGDTYPKAGGWLIFAIQPNIYEYFDVAPPGLTASPTDITQVSYVEWTCDFSASSKVENVAMDAVDVINTGTGLTLVGGDGADADGTFQDFLDFDEGTLANSYGLFTSREGIFYVIGTMSVGDDAGSPETPTVFTDSNQVVVFENGRVREGFFGMKWNTNSAQNVFTLTNIVFTSVGETTFYDRRADHTVNGTQGSVTFNGCNFVVFRNITLTSAATCSECKFINGEQITQAGATISECDFSGGTHGDGAAYVISDDPELISDCSFEFSDGHAIEITTPGTYDFTGNSFTGFGADDSTDAAILNNSGGHVTLNILGGGGVATATNAAGSPTNTIDVVFSVTLSVKVITRAGAAIENAQVAIYQSSDDTELLNADTNASGVASTSFAYVSDTPVYIRVRKSSTGTTRYFSASETGTIKNTGLSVTVTLRVDTTASS